MIRIDMNGDKHLSMKGNTADLVAEVTIILRSLREHLGDRADAVTDLIVKNSKLSDEQIFERMIGMSTSKLISLALEKAIANGDDYMIDYINSFLENEIKRTEEALKEAERK